MQPKLPERIVAALGRIGPASPMEVAQALGEDPTKVRVTLRRLDQDRRIKRTGYGRYELPAVPRPERLSTEAYVEREIVRFLTEKGGQARTRDIHREIWGGMAEAGSRPHLYVVVVRVLATSDKFENVAHGVWCLAQGK